MCKKKEFLGERNSYTKKLGRTDLTSNITFEKTEYMSPIRYTHQDSSFSYYNHLLFHFREKCGFVEPIYTSRILSNNWHFLTSSLLFLTTFGLAFIMILSCVILTSWSFSGLFCILCIIFTVLYNGPIIYPYSCFLLYLIVRKLLFSTSFDLRFWLAYFGVVAGVIMTWFRVMTSCLVLFFYWTKFDQ